jgi:hypothetical protein
MRKAKKPSPERGFPQACPEHSRRGRVPSRGISKKQLSVINDLFTSELDEQAVLDKYDVNRDTFEKWLDDERFIGQINERIAHSFRQSRLFIARYVPLVAARLVALTTSENQETARKACLDIISMDSVNNKFLAPNNTGGTQDNINAELSTETASRILAALAEGNISGRRWRS